MEELHGLQTAFDNEAPISLRAHNKRRAAFAAADGDGGGDGDGATDDEANVPPPPPPRTPWHNFEKEKLRRSLLYFGIGGVGEG